MAGTATYNDAALTVPLNVARLLFGDTNTSNPILSDNEWNFYLSHWASNPYLAAAEVADLIALKYATSGSFTIGPLSIDNGQKVNNLKGLSARLRSMAGNWATPGVTYAESVFLTGDPAPMSFAIGMDDYTSDAVNGDS